MDTQTIYDRLPVWVQTAALNLFALGIQRERYGSRFEQVLSGLMESQWKSAAELKEIQEEGLRALVKHAYETVPYYQQVMKERKLAPGDVRTVEDLEKLPLLTREIVAEQGDDLRSSKYDRKELIGGHTSGTTGSPLSFYWDRRMCIFNNAVDWRQKLWAGLERDTWYAVLLGRRIVSLERRRPPFWQPNYLHKQLWLSSFHMSDDTLGEYFKEMRRRNVQALEGYPSTCYIIARYLVRKGETYPLRCVLTSSETLHPVQRDTIEQAFACRVFDFYGLAERAIFATECDHHSGPHLNSEYGITEFVDGDGGVVSAGSRGYMVGTSLHNYAMPFLRYRTSDVARLSGKPCPCGRHLPLIDGVATKAEDLVITPDGRYVSPSTLTHPFKPLHGIRKSQIVQTSPDEMIVKIVPGEHLDQKELDGLVSGLRDRVGREMKIRVEQVDDIPPERSGKFRWVISQVAEEVKDLALWVPDKDEVH